jgi:hypothetical protein
MQLSFAGGPELSLGDRSGESEHTDQDGEWNTEADAEFQALCSKVSPPSVSPLPKQHPETSCHCPSGIRGQRFPDKVNSANTCPPPPPTTLRLFGFVSRVGGGCPKRRGLGGAGASGRCWLSRIKLTLTQVLLISYL